MSSTPSAKRRKLDEDRRRLVKPFRSPFKTPSQSVVPPHVFRPSSLRGVQTPGSLQRSKICEETTDIKHKAGLALRTYDAELPQSIDNRNGPAALVIEAALLGDPSISPLVKIRRELEQQQRQLKNELDTAQQAQRIEAHAAKYDPDGESDLDLLRLTMKWKLASRQALDGLFIGSKEKIIQMGGIKAWRKQQQADKAFSFEMEAEAPPQRKTEYDDFDSDFEGDHARQGATEDFGIDAETLLEKEARIGTHLTDLNDSEDEYTMGTLLATMNLDAELVGYNREGDCWLD